MSKLQYSDQEKHISEYVSFMLNIFGYNNKRTKERIEALNILSKAHDIQTKHITHQPEYEKKIVGSLREGISFFGTSDFDTLQIDHGVVVTENDSTVDGKVTFHMVTDAAPEGYCYLKLQHNGHNEAYQRLKHALVEQTNGTYLSSSAYTNLNDDIHKYGDGFSSHNVKYLPKNGPSIPRRSAVYQLIQNTKQIPEILGLSSEQCLTLSETLNGFNYTTDVVHTLPCIQETILDKWRTRKRISGWPNKDMVSKVINMPVYVVPVGCKGTQDENLQWRISFVEAELYLVQSLNDTQRKVLILAKQIVQNELKPISKHMKSYLAKMAVLWLAEKVPEGEFQRQHLIARLKDVLCFLKTSIANRVLPHYIVSERNLLEGKLHHDEHKMLISKIEYTIDIINKCVIRELGDKSEETLMNYVKCALVNIMTIYITNDIRRKTPEHLAKSFMSTFKCQSSWSYLVYLLKDDFSFLYKNLGTILKHLVVPCYTEAQWFCFFVDEAVGGEQSDTEGQDEIISNDQCKTEENDKAICEEQAKTEEDEQTFTEPGKQSNTRKVQLSQPPVKMNSKDRKESPPKILQHNNTLWTLEDNLANTMCLMSVLILTIPLLISNNYRYESLIHAYIFWFVLSFFNKNFRKKAMLAGTLTCMIVHCYNFNTVDSILMENLFTISWIKVPWSNQTVPIAYDNTCTKLFYLDGSLEIIHNKMLFLTCSQLPDLIGNFIWFQISSRLLSG